MPAGHPLIEDMPGDIPSPYGVGGSASLEAGPASLGGGVRAGLEAGEGHQTHLWVAGVILLSLAGLIALHITGFRFATDVGVTRG